MELTVPLVDRGNGLWGSSSPAWDHLINRESSGRPKVIQEIHDVNSGGNEAEGLFQITPKTWVANGGHDFAASARFATPQQQAIIAARIFTRNPSGSDWGAGRPGRESAADLKAGLVPAADPAAPTPPPAPPPSRDSYGMPNGSNSGGYGNGGVTFPRWVYDLGDHFGLKPSTYPGHQETDRIEAGYARNPQHLNRGIDWAAPGAPDEVDRMERFASYLLSIRGELEQVIWWNPRTGRKVGVAGGADVTSSPYYNYQGGYDDHRDHVHTRCSHSIPIPGNATPTPPPPPVPAELKPQFEAFDMIGKGSNTRSRPPVNFFLHTEEGNGTAKSLAEYCQGQNGVSYHWTLRDRKLYRVVPDELYSWSVLNANVFSVNLCFAGSRTSFTRQQWLDRSGDIEIAAWIAVQTARKYGFSTEVLIPDWARSGADVYAGQPRAGISDHNYVTRELGIGDHTDVGRNFPWDVFVGYVNKFASGGASPSEGFLMALSDAEQRELLDSIRTITREQTQKHPSRSALREPGEGLVDTWAGMDLNVDGNVDLMATFLRGVFKYPPAIERLKRVAAGGESGRSPDDALQAQAMLATLQAVWGILAGRPTGPSVVNNATYVRDDSAAAADAVKLRSLNERLTSELADVQQENADLRAKAAAAEVRAAEAVIPQQASPPTPDLSQLPNLTDQVLPSSKALAAPEPADEYVPTTGSRVADVVDAVEAWTGTAIGLDAIQRAAVAKSIEVLQLNNGSQS